MQSIKPIMVPVFDVLDNMQERSTERLPPPLNMMPLPPMMITEKGEPLKDFLNRGRPDFFTSLQACLPPF